MRQSPIHKFHVLELPKHKGKDVCHPAEYGQWLDDLYDAACTLVDTKLLPVRDAIETAISELRQHAPRCRVLHADRAQVEARITAR